MGKIISIVLYLFIFANSATAQVQLDKVSLQLHWKYQFQFAGFIMAKEKGFYKDVGLDVELKEYNFGQNIEDEVLSGKANYGIYSSAILLSYLQDKPIELMASFFKRSAMVIITKPDIKSPKDLIGKTIMADSKKDFDLKFKSIFNSLDIDTSSLKLTKHTYSTDDFINGKVDAMTAFISDQPHKLDELGIKYNILDPSDYGVYSLMLELFTSKNEAQNYLQRTKKFKTASIKGWQYTFNNIDETIKTIHTKYAPNLKIETLENEAQKIEKLILPYAYDIGSIDESYLNKQAKLFSDEYKIQSKRAIDEFLFDHQHNTIVDYPLVWQIIAVALFFILFGIYRQYQIQKYTKKLEELNKTLNIKMNQAVIQAQQKEKLLQEQTRLAQMGEMISMIAHQWRQPLSAISSSVFSITTKEASGKFDLEIKEDRDEFLEFTHKKYKNINEYVQILSNTIDDFRNFFKPDKEKELVNLTTPIKRALQIVENSMSSKNINITTEFDNSDKVLMYQNEMMQVILNILKNAEDNFVEKNTKKPQIDIKIFKKEMHYFISISDNGGGIPKKILPHIFDPYFSTKDEKNGTGLGLYMSKIMIEEHNNGKLNVNNSDDGVCFEIKLGVSNG